MYVFVVEITNEKLYLKRLRHGRLQHFFHYERFVPQLRRTSSLAIKSWIKFPRIAVFPSFEETAPNILAQTAALESPVEPKRFLTSQGKKENGNRITGSFFRVAFERRVPKCSSHPHLGNQDVKHT